LATSFSSDSIKQVAVRDTTLKQQYTYIVARVINNSVHQKNNYLTINRGSRHGISKGMGVTSAKGIVGIVFNVNEDFSTIRSLLHSETKVSANVNGSIGSLVWGEGNYDARFAYLKDIQSHLSIKKGNRVVTSEFSMFPEGTAIGYVTATRTSQGDNSLDIKIKLNTDFATLEYVYVINNILSAQQLSLEAQNKIE
jgi:rod shape-determining protein MreC